MKIKDLFSIVKVFSNRETVGLIVSGKIDAATGTRSVAMEFRLAFVEFGWEISDFVVLRDVYSHNIFQVFFRISVFFGNFEAIQPVRRIQL